MNNSYSDRLKHILFCRISRNSLQILLIILVTIIFTNCTKLQKRQKNQKDQQAEQIDSIAVVPESVFTTPDTLEHLNRTVQEMWEDFRAAKDSVDSARARNDFDATILALLKAAHHAKELNRDDIVAWQLNNIGFYSIDEFKKRTDYTVRMRNIESMRRGPEKTVYIKETKRLFKENLSLLIEGTKHLEEAYEVDKNLDDNDRTQKIYSNLIYIDWIRNFVNSD
ncbi:MAG: hypothetical protein KAU06_09650 [Candidatus Marinimicrobia bacterium]|nr:hypothetical protein [Candidatus Neomarinimicrobiota bacterium]